MSRITGGTERQTSFQVSEKGHISECAVIWQWC